MGGAVGFLYAASFPDDVEKLISLDIASPTVRNTESVVNVTGISIDRYCLHSLIILFWEILYWLQVLIILLSSDF